MLLAEALIEKDYIVESIDNLSDSINSLIYDVNDEELDNEPLNRGKLKNLFKEFEGLYTKYQQFSIMISRAESLASININKTEISLKDAMVIKNVMKSKLTRLIKFKQEVGYNDLDETIEMLRADIKTLTLKIQNKIWNTEVK